MRSWARWRCCGPNADLYQIVQDKLAVKRRERSLAGGAEAPSLLSGLIFDKDGNRMSPTHAVKKGKRYRYYVSAPLITGSRTEHLDGRRIPAGDIEGRVLDRLLALFASEKEVSEAIALLGLEAPMQRSVLDRSAKLAKRWTTLASLELRALVKSLVQQVRVGDAEISVWLNRIAVVSSAMPDAVSRRIESGRRKGAVFAEEFRTARTINSLVYGCAGSLLRTRLQTTNSLLVGKNREFQQKWG